MVVIDFETKSKIDLKKVGEWRYSIDPSTDVICLGFAIGLCEIELWCPGDPIPNLLSGVIRAGVFVEAHNYFFEYCIWENVLSKRYGFPRIPLDQFKCTAARAACVSLPRKLEDVGTVLKLKNQKDTVGHKSMLKVSKSDKFSEKQYSNTLEYCKQDVRTEVNLAQVIPDLVPYEQNIFDLNKIINLRGIKINVPLVKFLINVCSVLEKKLTEELVLITNGKVETASQVGKLLEFVQKNGTSMPLSLAAADVTEAISKEKNPEAKRVLEIRKALGMSSVKKLKGMIDRVGLDERVRGGLMYYGGHTGRDSGKGLQIQNFPRGIFKSEDELKAALDVASSLNIDFFLQKYPNTLEVVSSLLRSCIVAELGFDLIAGDFSAIEPRVLFWLSGEEKGLRIYRENGDIYKDSASHYFKVPYKEVNKTQRHFGKQMILSCGYGAGWKKFKEMCHAQGLPNVSDEEARLGVSTYRETYTEVIKFWRACEKAAIDAVMNPFSVYRIGKLSFRSTGKQLQIKLPSGRCLTYQGPEIHHKETEFGLRKSLCYWGTDSKTKKWAAHWTYGGKIVENCVQAVSRDLMAESAIRLEDSGYPVIMTVHDEVVTEQNINFGSIEDFEKIMSAKPDWAKDCPIKVEAWRGRFYKK